jgi:hypothetical protein
MTADEKKIVIEETERALFYLKKIYNDFDLLNGSLGELIERLDEEKYKWFHNFWSTFPTYNELDDLDWFLSDLKQEVEEKKK